MKASKQRRTGFPTRSLKTKARVGKPVLRSNLRARVMEWAAKLDVKVTAIYIRPMRRKWASCSTAGTLSFNDELLGMERDLGDYVIVHELLHFSVPNHGKLWKSLMRAHLGDWESIEERLQVNGERVFLPVL